MKVASANIGLTGTDSFLLLQEKWNIPL